MNLHEMEKNQTYALSSLHKVHPAFHSWITTGSRLTYLVRYKHRGIYYPPIQDTLDVVSKTGEGTVHLESGFIFLEFHIFGVIWNYICLQKPGLWNMTSGLSTLIL